MFSNMSPQSGQTPAPRYRLPRQGLLYVGLLIGLVGAGFLLRAMLVSSRSDSGVAQPSSSPVATTNAAGRDLLHKSLHAIEEGVRESPRDRWDPEYVVATVGRDPQ